MDIQMPEMDGYETARYIRRTLHRSAQELPILALTASVLASDRVEIEAAGMNDFIPKPFDPGELRHRIAAHLGLTASGDAPGAPPAPTPAGRINLAFLEEAALGQQDFMRSVIDLFLKQAPQQEAGLRQALAEEDRVRIHSLAHKMKASAALFGMEELAAALSALEAQADGPGRCEALPGLVEEVSRLWRGALEALEARRRTYV